MTTREPRNLPVSVRQRLLKVSREHGIDFNLVLTWYGIERLLYRLSRPPLSERFILKGAVLMNTWTGRTFRPTRDLDLLGLGESSPENLLGVFRDVCALDVEPDGLVFDPNSVRVEEIREEQEYGGLRAHLVGFLGKARIALRVDVGFGDAVTPPPQFIDYPVLLDSPAPRIRAYPPETVVAEKVQAAVVLGPVNSRMKDFYDLLKISTLFSFDGRSLSDAIRATFERRQTALPLETPTPFTDEFALNPEKAGQWRAFLRRTGLIDAPEDFAVVIATVREFVMPPLSAVSRGRRTGKRWQARTGWQ